MSGLSNDLPEHGGRVVLRRLEVGETAAEYAVQLLTKEGRLEGSARVSIDLGAIEFRELETAPEWLLQLSKSLLRGAWRVRAESGWPRRLTRWREAPETSSKV